MGINYGIEFYAYNFAESVTRKIYAKPLLRSQDSSDGLILLDDDDCEQLRQAFRCIVASVIPARRYTLHDVSLRESATHRSVGICYKDEKDYISIAPHEVFAPFTVIDTLRFNDINQRILDSMFIARPRYNPIFMIGFEVASERVTGIKSYIRFDADEAPTTASRHAIIQRIIRAVNPNAVVDGHVAQLAQNLEASGLVFTFMGVDCREDGMRFMLYFKPSETIPELLCSRSLMSVLLSTGIVREIFPSVTRHHANPIVEDRVEDMEEVIAKHENKLWGLALSMETFEIVNGLQLYFYP